MSSDHSDHMNRVLREFAGKGGFRVQEAAEETPGSAVMNRILRGQPPAAAPEAEPEAAYDDGDAAAGLGQSLPRRQPTMDDVLRGDHRAGRRERQEEAERARLERGHGRGHRSF